MTEPNLPPQGKQHDAVQSITTPSATKPLSDVPLVTAGATKSYTFTITLPSVIVAGVIFIVGAAWTVLDTVKKVREVAEGAATQIAKSTAEEVARSTAQSIAKETGEKAAKEAAEDAARKSAAFLTETSLRNIETDVRNQQVELTSKIGDLKQILANAKSAKLIPLVADSRSRNGMKVSAISKDAVFCMISRITSAGSEGATCALGSDSNGWTLKASEYGNGYANCEALCIGPDGGKY